LPVNHNSFALHFLPVNHNLSRYRHKYKGIFQGIGVYWQPVALVDFCATGTAKIPIIRRAANLWFDGVCKLKNRLIGAFFRF
jgi:hypothetical protein